MKKSLFNSLILTLLFSILNSCTGKKPAEEIDGMKKEVSTDLKADFINPPDYAGLRAFWWWLNSNVTEDCITKDLEAMKANGYGGAIIFDAGSSNYSVAHKTEPGPVFLSDRWMELYKHAIREADRLGLELTINVQSGWNPGGPSVKPENAMKKITWSETDITGPGKVSVSLPDPPSKLFYKDILVQVIKQHPEGKDTLGIKNYGIKILQDRIGWSGIYPLYRLREDFETEPADPLKSDNIIDVTEYVKEGNLTWDAPEGSVFVVFRDQLPGKHIVKVEKDGKEIFPGAGPGGSQFPAVECLNTEGRTVARISRPGTYSLQWSDGSENTFTEGNPLNEFQVSSPVSLKFINPWGPAEPLILEDLRSWTDFKDKQIRYYSGPAEYFMTFNIEKDSISGKRIFVDLGNVQEIAEIWINDNHAGVSWIAPFILDITGHIKAGENKLTIIVVNSWANRLIGDSYLPMEQRVTRTNVTKFEGDNKEDLIRESGLTGEVKIIQMNERILSTL